MNVGVMNLDFNSVASAQPQVNTGGTRMHATNYWEKKAGSKDKRGPISQASRRNI